MKIKKEAIIFVITVLSDPSTSLEVVKKGAKGIFLKPVNQVKLERAVRQFLTTV
jgi:DNA-binding NarL/FixJ family response regulator